MSESDTSSNCPPDEAAIKAAQFTKLGFSLLPFIGPPIADVAPMTRPPADGTVELGNLKGDLVSAQVVIGNLVAKFDKTTAATLQALVYGLDKHISNIAELLLLPTKHRSITNTISIIFIGLSISVIIMTLKRKNQ